MYIHIYIWPARCGAPFFSVSPFSLFLSLSPCFEIFLLRCESNLCFLIRPLSSSRMLLCLVLHLGRAALPLATESLPLEASCPWLRALGSIFAIALNTNCIFFAYDRNSYKLLRRCLSPSCFVVELGVVVWWFLGEVLKAIGCGLMVAELARLVSSR